ncbi:serine hydrolase [Streptomyces sp. AP-93]|uniref:serine hydrolase domain-containing protein n=1 Tax=Streptomyces sp. AP-93 TaxID=2929048 RepID=UPI001FAFFC6B|nr:serine hydrolase domain-containing protein [Streptomyces sp. AP-93]MCJ0872771.1 beta-lactamase family protein [Streptomyces sp. AP-93]
MRATRMRMRRACVAVSAAGALLVPVVAGTAYGATAPARSVSAAPSPDADTEFPQLTPAVAARLDTAVRQVMEQAQVPGVTVGLWAPGKGSYVKSFGVADKATGEPMKPGLGVRIGSETKTFTVTALLQLVDQGKLALDDPIGKYISGVPNGDRITLRELAGMRSGLFNYSEDPGFDKELSGTSTFTPQQLLDISFKHPVNFEPGAKFEYSNTNLILLGLLVEKITGRPIHEVIGQDVVKPAGLSGRTLFPVGKEFPEPHAHGYTNDLPGGKIVDATDFDPSWAWAAGAMVSDLEDLRSWAKTLATGTLLTPETQAERLKTQPIGIIPGAGYGLGIFNVQGWIGHNGSLPGYETLTVYLPQEQATMVVVLNTDDLYKGQEPSTLFGEAVTSIVTPGHVYPGHKPTVPQKD